MGRSDPRGAGAARVGVRVGAIAAVLIGAAFSLAACANAPVKAPLPPAPAPACVPVKQYDQAFLQALAAQYGAIPKDSPLAQAVIDYERLRDANRAACGAKP